MHPRARQLSLRASVFKRLSVLLIAASFVAPPVAIAADGPTHSLDGVAPITEWVVIGPFPNPTDGPREQQGFYRDYLASIGGESGATLAPGDVVTVDGQTYTARPLQTDRSGILDFEQAYEGLDDRVAYAFAYVDAPRPQAATFFLGSDDGAKVWVNGEVVHAINMGRGLQRRDDEFTVELSAGRTPVLVKVTELVGAWQLLVETADAVAAEQIRRQREQRRAFDEFLYCTIQPQTGNRRTFSFSPGRFPTLTWNRPELVEQALGDFPLHVRWFDAQLNEVERPEKPGRYGFYVEAETPDGMKIRRGGTMFCKLPNWEPWRARATAELTLPPADFINERAKSQHADAVSEYAGRIVMNSIMAQGEGALLMSYLYELEPEEDAIDPSNTPITRNQDYHVQLKRQLLGVGDNWGGLAKPQTQDPPAPVLRSGSAAEAGVKPDTAAKLRAVCEAWFEASDEPFVVCIARRGVIILHEPFGETARGKLPIDASLPVASITKLLTGLVFGQFVDQGLVDIDDPVGAFLPDFPTSGDKAITLRHCFTHTTGLRGHQEWNGLHEPWMENRIANSLPFLDPGSELIYNGMGYNLAGRVMEMVSGRSVFRLMREQLFDPLGLPARAASNEEDLGFGAHMTAHALATVGQMMLNRGAYGDKRYFSAETFERLLPELLDEYYPTVSNEWGVGITWMRQPHPDAGKNGTPRGQLVLSENVIGHGAATAAILRVDLDHDLVIGQSRRTAGREYNEHLAKLLMTLEEQLVR